MRIMISYIRGTNEIVQHKEFAIKNIQETPIWRPPEAMAILKALTSPVVKLSLNIAKCNPSFLTAI